MSRDGNGQTDYIFGVMGKKTKNELQEKLRKMKMRNFIPEDYFKERGTDEPRKIGEIVEDLEEVYVEDHDREQSDDYQRMKRIKIIYDKMWANGILEEVMKYIEYGIYGKAISGCGRDTIYARIDQLYDKIDSKNTEEILMMDAFFSNRMAKCIDAVMKKYYHNNQYIKEIYADFIKEKEQQNTNFYVSEFWKLNSEDLKKFVSEWSKSQGKKWNESLVVNDLSVYIKLNVLKTYMYKMKDEALRSLCKMHPKHIKYIDEPDKKSKKNKVYILLPEYAVPIVLHTNMSKDDFIGMGIERATIEERCVPAECIPLKLNPQEMKKFDEILTSKSGISIPRSKSAENDIQQTQVEQYEHVKQQEQTLDNDVKLDVVQQQRTNKKWRENEQVTMQVCDTIQNAGLILNISDEYRKELSRVSPTQKSKLDRVYHDLREFNANRGIEQEQLDVETSKMFFYMKVFNRGFWLFGQEEVYKRAYSELEKYGDEMISRINEGQSQQQVKQWLDEVAKRKRGIRGTKKEKVIARGKQKSKIKKMAEQGQNDINPLDAEIASLRAEYEELIQSEQIKNDGKKKIEKSMVEIINDKKSKKSKIAKIKIFLKPKNKELLLELKMEEKVKQLERQLEELERQLQKIEEEEKKNEAIRSKTQKEIHDIQKRKEEVAKKIQNLMDRNDL